MAQPQKTTPDPSDDELRDAFAAEATIAEQAAELRGSKTVLTPKLWTQLRPLLLVPIPKPFIIATTAGDGKPYASEGIRSAEVQRARMDAVLTPFWWWEREHWFDQDGVPFGQLVEVTIYVGHDRSEPLFWRKARGGMARGSTIGNLHKGSYTNTAKLAFARVGPGSHVYMGAADLDPDTDPDSAKSQAAAVAGDDRVLSPEGVQRTISTLVGLGLDDDAVAALLRDVGVTDPSQMRHRDAIKLHELVADRPAGKDNIARVREGIPDDWDETRLKLALVDIGVRDSSDVEKALDALTVGQATALQRAFRGGRS